MPGRRVDCAPEAYLALLSVLSRGGAGAKHIRHGKDRSDELLLGLAAMPLDSAFADATIRLFLKGEFGPQKMGAFAWGSSR